jgi:hypothetical protein
MSAAEKYGRSVESISSESLAQARDAGQALADKGVTQATSQGSGAPAPTPAVKYGGASDSLQRELPPPSRSL